MLDPLVTRLSALVGPDVAIASSEVGSEDGLLAPEHDAIANAIPKRRAEFAAGRRAARYALASAGHAPTAIPMGEGRAPIWPTGTVGSITHDTGLALACVAPVNRITHLGIDLTEAAAFPNHLRERILCSKAEKAASGQEARLIFSAKEAVFKAFYPDVGGYFGFEAVEITPDIAAERFKVHLLRDLGRVESGTSFDGTALISDSRLVTLLAVPAEPQP
ncbi:MAG: 4'-phosphopantetheinyl transferase superfamily protein [Pseudomonadota bacterium]